MCSLELNDIDIADIVMASFEANLAAEYYYTSISFTRLNLSADDVHSLLQSAARYSDRLAFFKIIENSFILFPAGLDRFFPANELKYKVSRIAGSTDSQTKIKICLNDPLY